MIQDTGCTCTCNKLSAFFDKYNVTTVVHVHVHVVQMSIHYFYNNNYFTNAMFILFQPSCFTYMYMYNNNNCIFIVFY